MVFNGEGCATIVFVHLHRISGQKKFPSCGHNLNTLGVKISGVFKLADPLPK